MSIAENITEVRRRIDAAARRVKRDPEEISLIAVSKTHPAERIREAYAAGLSMFGENRVQEFAGKIGALADLARAEWHLIGHLQSNKAGKAAELFSTVDSIDSMKLAQKLDAGAGLLGKTISVLIEINVGGEGAKTGVAPGSGELEDLLTGAAGLRHLDFRGLMTVPPYTEDPKGARPFFQKLRAIRDQIKERGFARINMDVLSMGMSHDFEIAIEEGSTCVRVGTAIFGERGKT
jgi:pyridoxal phosphate enzyme (YggS family)